MLVADEPVSALDVSVQAVILATFSELQEQLGLGLLLISHNLAVVRQVCKQVAVMYLGRIVEIAGRNEIFGSPRHPYTRALLAAAPRLHAPPAPSRSGWRYRPTPAGPAAAPFIPAARWPPTGAGPRSPN
jgi:ABC-type dipeptide/oligopeptide/nickel transport system ATPase component